MTASKVRLALREAASGTPIGRRMSTRWTAHCWSARSGSRPSRVAFERTSSRSCAPPSTPWPEDVLGQSGEQIAALRAYVPQWIAAPRT